jgi:hypothetical protein
MWSSHVVRIRLSSHLDNVWMIRSFYFFLPEARDGCHAASFRLGAAAITLIFSFLGFLSSRLPLCWPLAISISLVDDGMRTGLSFSPKFARAG